MDEPQVRELVRSLGIEPTSFTTHGRRSVQSDETRAALRQLGRSSRRSGRLSPLPYNLSISHRHRFLWFRVAKVATRTIQGHLQQQRALPEAHFMRTRYPTALFEDYFAFAFVRDPLTRFVSAWRDKVVQHNYFGFDPADLARMQSVVAFARWVGSHDDLREIDQHIALQSRLIDLTRIDFLGRLETFDQDFAVVRARVGLPGDDVRALNVTAPSEASSTPEASPELRELVRELYAIDYQIFRY